MHKDEAEGACAALENERESLYVSTQEGVSQLSLTGERLRYAPLMGAGALCAGEKSLFCADGSGAIWRMDRENFLPEGCICGGPGLCDLCLSPDEARLYALLGDADSVLMVDGRTGRPMLVNHCGCNPKQLLLCGRVLAAAGGESGMVHLYDADTLVCQREISMPGPVYSIAISGGRLYALCLTERLDTVLIVVEGKKQNFQDLQGMPGTLLIHENRLYAATQGMFYVFDLESLRLIKRMSVSGRPSRMFVAGKCVIAYDPLFERVYAMHEDWRWRMLCARANTVCISGNGRN